MRKLILSSMLIIVIISILGSCNVNPFWGGGIEVDIEAPLLTVDYPSAFDFVANGFTIRGTCTDNKEIARIVIKETRTGSEWLADINGNNWSKIITMDTDGEYVFDVYAYDATGNSSENSYKRITLTIDTTPPAAEVIYPPLLDVNVLKSYDFRNFDYIDYFKNQTFQIKGKTDSEYKVKSVTLELLDPSDDSVVYTNTISYDETLDQIVNINFGEPASAKQGSVWNWAFNIDCSSDILVAGNPLEKNKTYYFNARVKSKSMSDVEKVEKKKAVCVFNESDTPWQTITSIIDNDSVTPEAIISGNAYDDDGIKKIYIKIADEDAPVYIEDYPTWINESTDDSKTIIIDKSAETPKPRMFTWSANAPKAVGNYKIYVLTEDVNGKTSGSFTVKSFIVPQVFVSVTSPNNGDYKRTQENFVITGLWSNNIGEMKAISVKWIEGNVAQDASFDSTGWNVNSSLFGLTDGLQNFEITAFDKFGNKGITRLYIYADSIIPSVTNVSSSVDSGFYGPGDTIPISVQFSKRILVTGIPQISLNSGGNAVYTSGSGSDNLIFNYLVLNGENSSILDYNDINSLSLNGGSVKDYYIGDEANIALLPVGEGTKGAGSISVNKSLIVDATPPTVISVTSNPAEGYFNKDKMITIKVNFSETVIVEGIPSLKLNVLPEGKNIDYQFGSSSNSLTFIYTVEEGDNSADLDYFDVNSLSLNGGVIRDISGNPANITLPDLTGPNSIGAVSNVTIDTTSPAVPIIVEIDKEHFSITSVESTVQYSIDNGAWIDYLGGNVQIPLKSSTSIAAKQRDLAGNWSEVAISTIAADTTLPAVVNVTSTASNGSYKSGEILPITIQFTRDVIVTGTPQIKLETGETDRPVNYSSGSGTSLLIFDYTVQNGDFALNLDYVDTASLVLNGGTIKDDLSRDSSLVLSAPSTPRSLGFNKAIKIDTISPTVVNITSTSPNAIYKEGDVLPILMDFSEVVNVTGIPSLLLNSGAVVSYSSGTGTTTLLFNYTVANGDNAGDLDYLAVNSLSLNGGTIRDYAGNDADITLSTPGSEKSLGYNKNITIDTTKPNVLSVDSDNADMSYNAGNVISIKVEFDEPVTVAGTPKLLLETGDIDRYAIYSIGSGTNTIKFSYTVQAGDNVADLDYSSALALELGTATIKDIVGNDAVVTLPAPGEVNSLGENKNIVIDTVSPSAPIVEGFTLGALYGGTYYFTNDVTFDISGEAGAYIEYSINGGASWTTGISGSIFNEGNYVFQSKQRDEAGNISLTSESTTIVIDKTAPNPPLIFGIVSGTYNNTQSFNIAGENGAAFQYSLNNGANWFDYDQTVDLSTAGIYNVVARQIDVAGNTSSASSAIIITIDKTNAIVTNVTSPTADDSYNAGKMIEIEITFSKTIYVNGSPNLSLNTGAKADYYLGSGTNILKFNYIVRSGDNTADLDYVSTSAFSLNGGSIKDAVGNDANLGLPFPGSVNSLGGNKNIVIDTDAPSAPAILGLTSGSYNTDKSFTISGEAGSSFSYTLDNGGVWNPNNGETVTLFTEGAYNIKVKQTDAAGNSSTESSTTTVTIDKTKPSPPTISGITAGTFGTNQTFTVSGENDATFDYSINGGSSWTRGGGTTISAEGSYSITARQIDKADNTSDGSSVIILVIDKTKPSVIDVSSDSVNGYYNEGKAISIKVRFSEKVYVTDSPKITLETGGTDRDALFAYGSGTHTLTFLYTVQSGDTAADLDYTYTSALSLNGGSVKDAVGNDANLALPAPSGVNSLGGNKNIVIDTTAPSAPIVSGISTGRYNTSKSFTYSGESDATIQYTIDAGATWIDGSGTTLNIEGTYIVKGRQRDLAGNTSSESIAITVIIDNLEPLPPMISGIMAGTYNTTQSFSLSGEDGATLQYSFDGSNWNTLSSGSSRDLTADGTYNVRARQIDLAGNYSDPTSIVTVIIDKTKPAVSLLSPLNSALDVNVASDIVITFSEPVYRETGEIVIESFDADNKFVPAILTVDEYNEICSKLFDPNLTTFQESYSLGTNGAPEGTPDVVGRYILNYAIDITNSGLIGILDGINYFKVIIDVSSAQVTGSGTNAITINPFNDLAKGRKYKITIPAGSFRDSIGNTYDGNTGGWSFTTGPVATPVIRINKQSGNGDTQPTTTNFKISCETYGASIYYTLGDDSGSAPADPNTVSTTTNPGEIGLTGNYTSDYIKHIKAIAYKSPDLTASSIAEEKAYRTVLVKNYDAGSNYIWFRGSNNGGGPTTAPGFPLRWEENQLEFIKLGKKDTVVLNNWYWITWEVNQYVYSKPILGDKPADWETKGPMYFGWRTGVNDQGTPGTVITGIVGTGFEAWNAHTRPTDPADPGDLTIVINNWSAGDGTVYLTGDFNAWSPTANSLIRSGTSGTVTFTGIVTTDMIDNDTTLTAIDMKILEDSGNWGTAWNFSGYTAGSGIIKNVGADTSKIALTCSDGDNVTLTIDVGATTLTLTIE